MNVLTRRAVVAAVTIALLSPAMISPGLAATASGPKEQTATTDASDGVLSENEAKAASLAKYVDESGGLGVYFDFDRNQMVAVLPASRSDRFVGSAASLLGSPFRTETRAIEPGDIKEIEDQLLAGTFSKTTVGPYAFYFEPSTGTVRIEASGPASAFAGFRQRYAGMTTYVETFPTRMTRWNDIAPHFGGSYIRGGALNKPCTSGFTVKNANSVRFMVTAGHCYLQNDDVFGGTGINWGRVVNRAPFPLYDMELIGGQTYGLDIWGGGEAGTAVLVKGAADPVVSGNSYCTSGYTTHETCSHHVIALNATYCDGQGQCTPQVIAFRDGTPNQGGDSGSPFFDGVSGGVMIRGLFLGGGDGGTFYAERWTSVRDKLLVSIVHG